MACAMRCPINAASNVPTLARAATHMNLFGIFAEGAALVRVRPFTCGRRCPRVNSGGMREAGLGVAEGRRSRQHPTRVGRFGSSISATRFPSPILARQGCARSA